MEILAQPARPPEFLLIRIVGNDLEPRHRVGQSRDNLAFILEHEPPLPGCEKRFVLNRIVDAREEARLTALLAEHGQEPLRLPFDPAAYAHAGWDTDRIPAGLLTGPALAQLDDETRARLWHATWARKNRAVMNNNGARNAALDWGRASGARWILPWDGNCFLTAEAWETLRSAVLARPELPCFVTPMARIADNAELLAPGFAPEASEEPQILLRSDMAESFDAAFAYGRRPKVELFWRLGIPGPWDKWRDDPWDPPRNPPSAQAGRFGTAGWVARLASGKGHLERADAASFKARGVARRDGVALSLAALDAMLAPAPDPLGLTCYATGAVDAAHGPLAAGLVAAAEEALTRGPFSVIHKTTLPPGRNRQDYWHPAPYWWPNRWIPGGLPYVQRDGMRIPGTRMYEPASEAFDRTRLQRLFDDTTALALAWRRTGRAEFAAHAARNVAVWFVDPATRMTPHLRYAQVRRGRNWNQGTGAGIIELKDLYYFLDAVRILDAGGALPEATRAGLETWLRAYLAWLETSRQGARERGARNNHGAYYDLQTAAILAWLGEREPLRRVLVRAQTRLLAQISSDGTQPEEMKRKTTAHYVFFNLQGWLNLLRLGRRTGLLDPDLATLPWSRLVLAVDWALAQDLAAWPYPQLDPFDAARALPLALHAADLGLPVAAPDVAGARPAFDPHDGVPPFWALCAAPPPAADPADRARDLAAVTAPADG